MLDWTERIGTYNNKYWIGPNCRITQELIDNTIKYVVRDTLNIEISRHDTIEEAKKSREPSEKPYEVGHFEERKWGSFTVLEKGDGYLIKKLFIKKGCSISNQFHNHRSEQWIVLKGLGDFRTQLPKFQKKYFVSSWDLYASNLFDIKPSGDIVTRYGAGAYIEINPKQPHKWTSVEDTEILEVWRGQDLRESDIVRLDV